MSLLPPVSVSPQLPFNRFVIATSLFSTGASYHSSWHALQTIRKYEGLRGIYRGYGSTLASFGPYSALMFAFYEQFKRMAQNYQGVSDLSFGSTMVVGAAAASMASLLTNPLDMIKLRLQIQRRKFGAAEVSTGYNYNYKGLMSGLKSTAQDEGLRSLLQGAGSRMLFSAALSATSLAGFEYAKQQMRDC